MLRLVVILLFISSGAFASNLKDEAQIRADAVQDFGQEWVEDIESWMNGVNDNVAQIRPHQTGEPTPLTDYLDPGHWVNRYLEQKQGNHPYYTEKGKPKVQILVSMSMPSDSVRQWARQANEVKAPLVMRGLVENSFTKTTKKAMELFMNQQVGGFSIDPKQFETLGIDRVPAVVIDVSPICLKEPCEQIFDVVYGNMGLWEALSVLSNKGQPEVQVYAKQLLQQANRL
jgi:type-F conjugative transfer system pilin assembly protein TrbC